MTKAKVRQKRNIIQIFNKNIKTQNIKITKAKEKENN